MTEQSSPGGGGVVVFGASGGIGSAVASQLAGRGLSVVRAARQKAGLDATAPPGRTLSIECDVTRPDAVKACLDAAVEFSGDKLSGVALCVGSLLLKPAHRTTEAEWDLVIAQNLSAAFNVVRAAVPLMQRGGSLVFCSSAAASVGLANHDAIAAAKAGIEGLVRSAAATYASRGVRFNAVAPGLVRTPLTESITSNERAVEMSRSMHALGRIGEPEDVAAAILWLLEPANSWVSGTVVRVDGGLAQLRPMQRG